jgi:hypothetical protein
MGFLEDDDAGVTRRLHQRKTSRELPIDRCVCLVRGRQGFEILTASMGPFIQYHDLGAASRGRRGRRQAAGACTNHQEVH